MQTPTRRGRLRQAELRPDYVLFLCKHLRATDVSARRNDYLNNELLYKTLIKEKQAFFYFACVLIQTLCSKCPSTKDGVISSPPHSCITEIMAR